MKRRPLTAGVLLACLVAAALGASSLASAEQPAGGPISRSAEAYSLSVPVRDLSPRKSPATPRSHSRFNPLAGAPAAAGSTNADGVRPDPLIGDTAPSRTPAKDLLFNG